MTNPAPARRRALAAAFALFAPALASAQQIVSDGGVKRLLWLRQ